jgi:uncharacterized cupin superfamily protein
MATTSDAAIKPSVRASGDASNWVSCPVNPAWVLEGSPVARIEHLSSSADGTASTYFWDCTAGRFNWFYTFDETLHILEGSMTLKFPEGHSKHVVAGDIVFFPNGSRAEWSVDKYVRKLAFCRTVLPDFLVSARDAVRRVRRLGRAPASGAAAGIFSNG